MSDREPINETATRFLESHAIREGRILVGVSGGADSVALLRLLNDLAGRFRCRLLVGHFDHAIRSDSADDANWVRQLCERFEIPVVVQRSASDEMEREKPSEELARRCRYEFLQRTAITQNCRWIAVAHTSNDQVETVLHHILRGTGLKGLSGIPEVRRISEDVLLIRPLLQVSREQIVAFLDHLGQPYLTDPTNASDTYTRNRIRNELLPLLRTEFNPQVDDALERLGSLASDTQQTIEILASKLLDRSLLDRQPDSVRIDRSQLMDAPVGLIRELFSVLWQQQNWPRRELSAFHLEQLAQLTLLRSPSRLSLPNGFDVSVRKQIIHVWRPSQSHPDNNVVRQQA